VTTPPEYRGRAHPRRNSRNPLRVHLQRVSIAITEANRIDHVDDDWIDRIRRGVEAVRALADELAYRGRAPAMNELTPKDALVDVFDSDDFPAIANPQEAAEVFVQRLIDAGFEIKAQERAPIMNVGADRQGGAIASAWPPTTQDG
jgi:hypothetical protein